MKIEVAKKDLEAALQVVGIATTSKGSGLDTHYVFRHHDGFTQVLAYANRLGASSTLICNATLDEDEDASNAFTIEAKRLDQWLKATTDAALSLESDGAQVTCTSPMGKVKFRSLDPSAFPFWDKSLTAAKKSMTIDAGRLTAALAHVKSFVSALDTAKPEMAVTEVREGAMWATDQSTLTLVTLKEFAKSKLRVHGKDISAIERFLTLSDDDDVEVLEHSRSLYLKREDGALLNVGRPTTPFIELEDIEEQDDMYYWTVATDDVERAIKQLSAGAATEDLKVTFGFADDKVVLSMTADSGETNKLAIPCPEHGSVDKPDEELPEGWTVEYPYIMRLLSSYKGGKTIKMGLNPAGEDGGWTRFMEDRDGDRYLTILVWMPE